MTKIHHIEDKDLGWQRIKRELALVKGSSVTAGIHESDAARKDEAHTTTAQVGAWHEYGTRKMPARPWMAPTIDDLGDDLHQMADELRWRGIMQGKISTRAALGLIGLKMETALRDTLRNKRPEWPPLTRATIWRKARLVRGSKREGKKRAQRQQEFREAGGNPLIDTAQLLNSIRHRVEMGGALGG